MREDGRAYNQLIGELVDEDEVLSDGIFREDTAVILDDLDDTEEDLHAVAGREVHLGGDDEVDAVGLGVHVSDGVLVLRNRRSEIGKIRTLGERPHQARNGRF